MPRILHCISTLNRGGAERQLMLLLSWQEKRYQCAVLYLREDAYSKGAEPPQGFPTGVDRIRVSRGAKWNVAGLFRRIYRQVVRYRPDLVHLWLPEVVTFPAAVAARRLGVPCISSQRGQMLTPRQKLRYLTHCLASTIVANYPIECDKRAFRRLFSSKHGAIICNAIDRQEIDALRPRPALHPEVAFWLIFSGRLIPLKRVDLLIRAVALLSQQGLDAGLMICGQDEAGHECSLRQLAQSLRVDQRVFFLGHRPDWIALAKSAHLCVLPSISEGMPNVLLEASAAGVPVVASDILQIRSVYSHDSNAYLFKPASLDALLQALTALLKDAPRRARLAEAGKALSERYSVASMAARFDDIYERLLG